MSVEPGSGRGDPYYRKRWEANAEEFRLFLLKLGNDADTNDVLVAMIEEGGATWYDKERMLSVDYRHSPQEGSEKLHYRLGFSEDGQTIQMLAPSDEFPRL